MQARAAEDFKKLVTDKLTAAGLTFDRADAAVTPRRLALVVNGLPLKQPDVERAARPADRRSREGDPGFLDSDRAHAGAM